MIKREAEVACTIFEKKIATNLDKLKLFTKIELSSENRKRDRVGVSEVTL